jgi:hypothetical protein
MMNGEGKVAIYSHDAPMEMQENMAGVCYLLDLQTLARAWFNIDRPLVMAAKDLLAACEAAKPYLEEFARQQNCKSVVAEIVAAAIRKAKGTPNA